jgi:3-oxoacyl-[acyl-carrier-protein] synthase III
MPEEAASDLESRGAGLALQPARVPPDDLALVVVATSTPDHPQPPTACLVQDRIGAVGAAAFDLNAVCSGFVYALMTHTPLLGQRRDRPYALVIGVDVYSRIVDPTDRKDRCPLR